MLTRIYIYTGVCDPVRTVPCRVHLYGQPSTQVDYRKPHSTTSVCLVHAPSLPGSGLGRVCLLPYYPVVEERVFGKRGDPTV